MRKVPREMGRKLIFLDIDGVLNGDDMEKSPVGNICLRRMGYLNSICRNTQAEVIISSSWRDLVNSGGMNLSQFKNMMISMGMSPFVKITGCLGPDQDENTSDRGSLIKEYIDREVKSGKWTEDDVYVAIDDTNLGYTAAEIPFVRCQSREGLTPDLAEEITDHLMFKLV